MKPTEEQAAVVRASVRIASDGGAIRVSAGAGTGKTSTLRLVAETVGRASKTLYLAYNRAISDEAQPKFAGLADVSTLHSMAHRQMKVRSLRRPIRNLSQRDAMTLLGLEKADSAIARDALLALTKWCHTETAEVGAEDAPPDCHPQAVAAAARLFELIKPGGAAERASLPHDVYVKAWGLAGAPGLSNYNLVLLDEAQDSNPVVLDAVSRAHAVTYVGDQHQQIYRWRGTISAMSYLRCQEYPLTLSFRWGPKIANIANSILALKKNNPPHYLLRGDHAVDTQIQQIDPREPHARIYRYNLPLMLDAITMRAMGRKTCIVGDNSSLLSLLKALESLRAGHVVHHYLVAPFESWHDLVRTLSKQRASGQLWQAVQLIEGSVGGMRAIYAALETDPSVVPADSITYTTAHKAKGREWPRVALGDDFQTALTQTDGSNHAAHDDELNLLYVAVTRATHVLDFSRCRYLADVILAS